MAYSFIQNPKFCFFFSRKAEKKNTACIFFFPQKKFIGHSFDFFYGLTYFIRNWAVFFFFRIFACFFLYFFFPEKVHVPIHSFDLKAVFFFFSVAGKKKNTAFSFIQSIFSKSVVKMNFFREKKIRYLCYH